MVSIVAYNQSQTVCSNPHFNGIYDSDKVQIRPEISLPLQDSSIIEKNNDLLWKGISKVGMISTGIVITAALTLSRQYLRELNPLRFSLVKGTINDLTWKRIFKIGIISAGMVIAAVFIDDLFNINFRQNPRDKKPSDVINQSIQQTINQGIAKEKTPCAIKMEPYALDIDGDCTKEEIERGKSDYKIFMENFDKQIKEEAAKEVEKELKKFDARVAPTLKRMEMHEMLRKENERRKNNPTPEEKEEEERATIKAAVKNSPFMEPYFRAKYPQYFEALPIETQTCNESCQQEARKILQVSYTASCPEIKKHYRTLSLKVHPDKNPDLDKDIFLGISQAYKKLCP